MSGIKQRIENQFEKLAHVLYQNPFKVLFISLLFIGFLSFQAGKITIDTSSESMFYPDDPIITEYKAFQDQFGRDEVVFIAAISSDIFKADFLKKLKSFHNNLENEVPHIQKIYSLINAESLRSDEDAPIVEELLSNWPEKESDLTALKKNVLNNPVLKNFVSENSKLTGILIQTGSVEEKHYGEEDLIADLNDETLLDGPEPEKLSFLSEKERREFVDALRGVVKSYHGSDFSVLLTGYPVLLDTFNRIIAKDVVFLGTLGLVVVSFFLWLLFRRISGLVIPAIIICSSLFSTFGVMALFKIPMTLTTSAMPTFILAVGVADAIHILSVFYRHFHNGVNKKDAISFAMAHSGPPVLLTSLTTAAGLISFTFTDLLVITQLGACAAVGVVFAFVYTIVLMPAILALIPIKQKQTRGEEKQTFFVDRALLSIAGFSTGHPLKIVAACLVVSLIAFPFVCKLNFDFNLVDAMADPKTLKELSLLDKELKGTVALEVVADTKKINGISKLGVLNKIENFANKMLNYKDKDLTVGKVTSIGDLVKGINLALNENDYAYYKIPQDQKTLSQEIFLLRSSGLEGLQSFVDGNFSKARITIYTTWADSTVYEDFINVVQQQLTELFQDTADIRITGMMAFFTRALNAAVQSMAEGYMYAFLAITILMVFLVGDVKLGLIVMLPNILPIFLILGVVGYLKIPLDMLTMLIGCIAMGIVVDDTMHFVYNFQMYYGQSKDPYEAVRKTMTSTGRAIFITSIILSSCFYVQLLASTKSTVRFGLLTGTVIILALLSDFFLAPALMVLVKGKQKGKLKQLKICL